MSSAKPDTAKLSDANLHWSASAMSIERRSGEAEARTTLAPLKCMSVLLSMEACCFWRAEGRTQDRLYPVRGLSGRLAGLVLGTLDDEHRTATVMHGIIARASHKRPAPHKIHYTWDTA